MNKIKYLHIGGATVFFEPLLDLIDKEFCSNEHIFILTSSLADQRLEKRSNVLIFSPKSWRSAYYYLLIIWRLIWARKVFFHGLFDPRTLFLLRVLPFWEKKSYWIAWGADLYDRFYATQGIKSRLAQHLRACVIRRCKHIVTYLKGDYARALAWFGCQAEYHECLMYPSNLYKECASTCKTDDYVNIMIGNSADPLNFHLEVFEKLAKNLPEKYRIYSPLSYGNDDYKEVVKAAGLELFGPHFIPLEQLMGAVEYTNFLSSMDVVIFNHPIQQAMGNTITALGLGNRVYLQKGTSQWEFFTTLGIQVHDAAHLEDISDVKVSIKNASNRQKISLYFSEKTLTRQLTQLFELGK